MIARELILAGWSTVQEWPRPQRDAAVSCARAGYVGGIAHTEDGLHIAVDLTVPCCVTTRVEDGITHIVSAHGPSGRKS